MRLFVAPNISESVSKHDGVLYPYITRKGLPIAFEEESLFWKVSSIGNNGLNAQAIDISKNDYILSRGSFSDKSLKTG